MESSKRVRGWTSGRSLPVYNVLSTPRGPLSFWKSRKQLFDHWLKRWFPHSLPNRQSLSRIRDLFSIVLHSPVGSYSTYLWHDSPSQSFTLMSFIVKENNTPLRTVTWHSVGTKCTRKISLIWSIVTATTYFYSNLIINTKLENKMTGVRNRPSRFIALIFFVKVR